MAPRAPDDEGAGAGVPFLAAARLSRRCASCPKMPTQWLSCDGGLDAGTLRPGIEENSPVAHQHKACRLLGQISGVVAAYERMRRGEEPIKPRMDLDHAANFLWMLSGEDPEPLAAKALDQYLLLLAEHELNASTFTARVIASTGSELHSADHRGARSAQGPGAWGGGARSDGAIPARSARRTTSMRGSRKAAPKVAA